MTGDQARRVRAKIASSTSDAEVETILAALNLAAGVGKGAAADLLRRLEPDDG